VAELLSPAAIGRAGYFSAPAVQKLLAKCRSGAPIGAADNMMFVGVLSTQILDSLFVRHPAEAAPPAPLPAVV